MLILQSVVITYKLCTYFLLRIHQGSALSPLLLYADESGNLDAVDIITEMAKVEKCRSPQYVSADALPFREVCLFLLFFFVKYKYAYKYCSM